MVTVSVVVGVRARLVHLRAKRQVAAMDSQLPCLLQPCLASSSTPYCEFLPLSPRTDESETTTGTSGRRRKLEIGLIKSRRETWQLTQQEGHRHAMTHFQDGCLLAVDIDGGCKVDSVQVQRIVLVGAEGKVKD